MKKEEQKIDVSIFNWGPCVLRMKIVDDLKKLLLTEGKKNTKDFTTRLAGIIEKETGYDEEAKAKVVPYLSNYLGVYDQMYEKFINKKYEKRPHYVMSALWINYQKAGEFNPPHDHDGKLSFVIYLQIPDELKKEQDKHIGTASKPGSLTFLVGQGAENFINYKSFVPQVGDFFIFPKDLYHFVEPFKSKGERISLAFNLKETG